MNNIDFEKVKELWKKNTRETILYVHNPFCNGNNCSYCCHACYPTNDQKLVEKFYFEYYPKLLDLYKDIIQEQNITLANFGGGLPNYLSAEKFSDFLNLFPDKIKKINKVIELHPAYITREFLDVLKKNNFTTLTFCFQTFDQDILKKNKRATRDLDEIKELWDYAKKLGFTLATDLITCWDIDESDNWINVLENDIKILKELQPDEISISPLYQVKYSSGRNMFPVYKNIANLIIKHLIKEYNNPDQTISGNFKVNTIRMYNKNSNLDDFQKSINGISDFPWEFEQGYATLGMGEYDSKFKPAYSIIGPNYTVYERFNGFDNLPKFELIKNYNFWTAAHNVLYALEEQLGQDILVGSTLTLQNVAKIVDEDSFFSKPKIGNCNFDIQSRCCYSPMSEKEQIETNKFVKKIKCIDKNKVFSYNS